MRYASQVLTHAEVRKIPRMRLSLRGGKKQVTPATKEKRETVVLSQLS